MFKANTVGYILEYPINKDINTQGNYFFLKDASYFLKGLLDLGDVCVATSSTPFSVTVIFGINIKNSLVAENQTKSVNTK